MRAARGHLLAIGLVLLATAVGLPLRGRIALSELVMIYFLAIVLAGLFTSRAPAFVAALASVALFDFLFIPPYLTLRVDDWRHIPTFVTMLVIGIVIGDLTTRLRENARAKEREALRSTLLSSVSHDLRTPLSTIKGVATALLGSENLDPAARHDLLSMVQEEADRLERLVSNLLSMTRLESGGLRVRKQWVPLDEVVGCALRRYEKPLAGRVTVTIPEEALVAIDDVLMENVVSNVLENAIRHTPAGTPIEIRASLAGADAILEISDRGPGIAAGDEERVFEKFGGGLGLAICRGIVEAHGGRMTAHRRDGGGAMFRVAIPAGTPPSVPRETS